MRKSFKNFILLTALTLFSYSTISYANFSIQSSTGEPLITVRARPGGSFVEKVIVINHSETDTLTLSLSMTDAKINQNGIVSYSSEKNTEFIGAWSNFPSSLVTLAPGENKEIPFTVRIPKNAGPGVYTGGVSAKLEKIQSPKGSTAKAIPRVIQKILLEVEGKRIMNYQLGEFEYLFEPINAFTFSFQNTGNTLIRLDHTIEVEGFLQKNKQEIKGNSTYFSSGESSSFTIPWQNFDLANKARLSVTISSLNPATGNYEQGEIIKKEIVFSQFRITAISIFISLLAISIIIFIFGKIKWAIIRKKSSPYITQNNDTILKIAEKNEISWKKLAKTNKLKKPYQIQPGQIILVPPSRHHKSA